MFWWCGGLKYGFEFKFLNLGLNLGLNLIFLGFKFAGFLLLFKYLIWVFNEISESVLNIINR